jgi:hypothetical protein
MANRHQKTPKYTIADPYQNNKIIPLDSQEEQQFYNWCIELAKYNLIKIWSEDNTIYQPPSFPLSDKVLGENQQNKRTYNKTLLRDHVYTPDFKVTINKYLLDKLFPNALDKLLYTTDICDEDNQFVTYIIDIKGTFAKADGGRSFSINQKWVYAIHHVYINKVIPDVLFEKTFVPEVERYTPKTNKLRQKYINHIKLADVYNIINGK